MRQTICKCNICGKDISVEMAQEMHITVTLSKVALTAYTARGHVTITDYERAHAYAAADTVNIKADICPRCLQLSGLNVISTDSSPAVLSTALVCKALEENSKRIWHLVEEVAKGETNDA